MSYKVDGDLTGQAGWSVSPHSTPKKEPYPTDKGAFHFQKMTTSIILIKQDMEVISFSLEHDAAGNTEKGL